MVLVIVLLLAKQIITLYHAVQKTLTKDQHALVTLYFFILMVNAGSSAFAVPILKNPLMEFRDVILNQDQKSSFNETIDEYSGALYVSSTDLTIPGNSGLDINIVRHYSTPWTSNSNCSAQLNQDTFLKEFS